jgi:hypothetical protein
MIPPALATPNSDNNDNDNDKGGFKVRSKWIVGNRDHCI